MKTELFNLEGKAVKLLELPLQFREDYEPVLVKRALLVIRNHRKRYGAKKGAGLLGVSAKVSRRRRDYKGSYGHGISRVPRKVLWRRGTQFGWVGAEAPGTVKGRRAHPPKAEKSYNLKINKKERKKAIRSALSGIAQEKKLKLLAKELEDIKKSKELKQTLQKLGYESELKRLETTKIRSGKGKHRGRKYQTKKGPVFVVSGKCGLHQAAKNLSGIEVIRVKDLNADTLTRGNDLRENIWTENALKKLEKEKMFQ